MPSFQIRQLPALAMSYCTIQGLPLLTTSISPTGDLVMVKAEPD